MYYQILQETSKEIFVNLLGERFYNIDEKTEWLIKL